MNLKDIDPSFSLLKEFGRVTKGTAQHIDQMRAKAIFSEEGTVPKKHKALAAALWSISARCEPCFKFYISKAKEFGATEEETGEFLAIATTMGGCVGEMWALKAFQAFRDEGNEHHPETCCT